MDKNEIILFETDDHTVKLNVSTDGNTVWLSRTQLAELFDRDISVIGRHINAVFKENELDRESNVQNLHITNKLKLRTSKMTVHLENSIVSAAKVTKSSSF